MDFIKLQHLIVNWGKDFNYTFENPTKDLGIINIPNRISINEELKVISLT